MAFFFYPLALSVGMDSPETHTKEEIFFHTGICCPETHTNFHTGICCAETSPPLLEYEELAGGPGGFPHLFMVPPELLWLHSFSPGHPKCELPDALYSVTANTC